MTVHDPSQIGPLPPGLVDPPDAPEPRPGHDSTSTSTTTGGGGSVWPVSTPPDPRDDPGRRIRVLLGWIIGLLALIAVTQIPGCWIDVQKIGECADLEKNLYGVTVCY